MGVLNWLRGRFSDGVQAADGPNGEIPNGHTLGYFDGENYAGGLGAIQELLTDYWALRKRSSTFFKSNQYGKGIIRRFVTNVINTGLSLEADPITSLIPFGPDEAQAWAEEIEDRFLAYANSPTMCDWRGDMTFGRMQREIYREALIEGDVLVIEHYNAAMVCPQYEVVPGSAVVDPFKDREDGVVINYGVELDDKGRQVAYYVAQQRGETKRIPAYGKNGRRMAWLVYGTDKRRDECRGEPLLSVVMQGIGEALKFRDAAQRKASINAIFAMYFYHDPNSTGPTAKPLTGGATRRMAGSADLGDGTEWKFDRSGFPNGVVMDKLPKGVMPKAVGPEGTDVNFRDFEAAIVDGCAWALEIPPSILRLVFGNSYSASRGEVKEFDMALNVLRDRFADQHPRRVYRSWLRINALGRKVSAPGYIDATRDIGSADTVSAWENTNWWGRVKEAVDLPKEVNGRSAMADRGYTTNSAAARALTGTSFRKNIEKVKRENILRAEAMRPLLDLEREYGAEAVKKAKTALMDDNVILLSAVGDRDE